MSTILYGFDGSTYVRTVRMVMAVKKLTYATVPVNVLEGEPGKPEHLARHPFGKVPVLDHDNVRLYETSAICRYLDETVDGTAVVPASPVNRARMNMAMGIVDSYGYPALVGVAGYHLFPDLIGGRNKKKLAEAIKASKTVLGELMRLRGKDPWIAGKEPSLADFFLAPICFYVSLTDDKDKVFDVPGFADWWARVQELDCYKKTEPKLD